MHPENRRSFVKKTLATSVSISFAGLIRAHGEEGGGSVSTVDPWGGGSVSTSDPWSGGTISLTNPDDFTIVTAYTVNQWDWWSVYPVTDGTVVPCPPHAWENIGAQAVSPDGQLYYPRWCTKCHITDPPHITWPPPQ